PRISTARRSSSSRRTTLTAGTGSDAASLSRRRRPSISTTLDPREVRRRDVADDFGDQLDLVPTEPGGVLAHHLLARRSVDAVGRVVPVAVDDDVAVLPLDLRELLADQLAGAAADNRHLGLSAIELTDDHVSRHGPDHTDVSQARQPGGGYCFVGAAGVD